MTLTAGQKRWLDRHVDEDYVAVLDGTVSFSSVEEGQRTVVVEDGRGGQGRFVVPAAVDPQPGEPASVRLEGKVTQWSIDEDEVTRFHVTADNGSALVQVEAPMTPAEERDADERRQRQQRDAENARKEAARIAAEEAAAARAAEQAERERVAAEGAELAAQAAADAAARNSRMHALLAENTPEANRTLLTEIVNQLFPQPR